MIVDKTPLQGVLVITPKVFRDSRGFFFETYHEARYREAGVDIHFVQDNLSSSAKNTLRGLHAQVKQPQAKLVRCIEGEIYDVVVDIRKGSPTLGQSFGDLLSADNAKQIFVPEGFVHGFCVMSERAQIEYKCSDFYAPDDQLTVLWNDPELGIDWPIQEPILSDKDRTAPTFQQLRQQLGL